MKNIPRNCLITLRIWGYAFDIVSKNPVFADKLSKLKIKNIIVDTLFTEQINFNNNLFHYFKDSEYLTEVNVVEHRSEKTEEFNLNFLNPKVRTTIITKFTDKIELDSDEDDSIDEVMNDDEIC